MPWDRRTETQTAKRRRQDREVKREKDERQRLEKEKFNSIDQYLLSGDEQVERQLTNKLNHCSFLNYEIINHMWSTWLWTELKCIESIFESLDLSHFSLCIT